MAYSPIAIKRRNVLGDIYGRCDPVESIPVYLHDKPGELLGHVDESLGKYADAFLFHLPEMICKKLATGHFNYVFGYEYSDEPVTTGEKKRIILTSILLAAKTKETHQQYTRNAY